MNKIYVVYKPDPECPVELEYFSTIEKAKEYVEVFSGEENELQITKYKHPEIDTWVREEKYPFSLCISEYNDWVTNMSEMIFDFDIILCERNCVSVHETKIDDNIGVSKSLFTVYFYLYAETYKKALEESRKMLDEIRINNDFNRYIGKNIDYITKEEIHFGDESNIS